MDKEEAIKILKDFHDKSALFSIRTALETLHPDLKESEDEKTRKALISFLKSPFVNENITDEKVAPWLAWLEKQGEQKPVWGEVDKDFMYDTISNLTELKDRYGEGYGNVGKCIDWLKSLKDRYTWKPSDEQMKALHDLNLTGNISHVGQGQVLIGLYNDLKKLRGE